MIKKITTLIFLLFIENGLAFANPPGTFQPLLLNTASPAVTTTFIGSTNLAFSNGGNLTWPGGTAAGDVAIILIGGSSASLSASGYSSLNMNTQSGGAPSSSVFVKILTSGDISSPGTWSATNGSGMISIYRGPTSVTIKNATNASQASGTSLAISGFATSPSSSAVITVINIQTAASAPTAPTGFTRDANYTAGFYNCFAIARIISTSYTGGTSTWTSVASTVASGVMIELI